MKMFAQYFVREGNKRIYLMPGKMVVIHKEPNYGEIVSVNGIKYKVTGANYDYELW